MSDIAIVGAGVSGLASALALVRNGNRITVFERDPLIEASGPHEAFEQDRKGAPQIRHSHAFLARLRNQLRDLYPDVLQQLYDAGATDLRFDAGLPPALQNCEPESTDDDLAMLACRRTTFEWVLRRAAEAQGHVVVRSGVDVRGLTGTPQQVTGVRLADGTTEAFDLVVVATGRRGGLPQWLEQLGAPPVPEVHDDSGIVYFSRYYRLRTGFELPTRTGPIGGDLGYLKYGVFPGDNGTFSITLATASDDTEMRKLLDDEVRFDTTARALTFTAPYLDGRAEPISGVHKIAGLISRWRDYVVDGKPAATGVFPVGDALLATNPLYGRGCSTGFWSAQLLAQALIDHPDDPVAAALAYDGQVQIHLKPWVMATIRTDEDARRVAAAILAGVDPDGDPSDPKAFMRSVLRDGLRPALRSDIHVLRAFSRNFNLLTPADSLVNDADFGARVFAAWNERANRPPEPVLGPDRPELMQTLISVRSNARPKPTRTPAIGAQET